jgi:hypothetical protein
LHRLGLILTLATGIGCNGAALNRCRLPANKTKGCTTIILRLSLLPKLPSKASTNPGAIHKSESATIARLQQTLNAALGTARSLDSS